MAAAEERAHEEAAKQMRENVAKLEKVSRTSIEQLRSQLATASEHELMVANRHHRDHRTAYERKLAEQCQVSEGLRKELDQINCQLLTCSSCRQAKANLQSAEAGS